jgi:hypothetical protein
MLRVKWLDAIPFAVSLLTLPRILAPSSRQAFDRRLQIRIPFQVLLPATERSIASRGHIICKHIFIPKRRER